jgi:hypothetical protein
VEEWPARFVASLRTHARSTRPSSLRKGISRLSAPCGVHEADRFISLGRVRVKRTSVAIGLQANEPRDHSIFHHQRERITAHSRSAAP